ncbi:disulfide bond formation protein B [Aliamphritea ceti]|uniref:disulfide bond formation protein B n=1 Tax=Aliamphritea ceti TaxID=1524258 RepID=UPI0021C2776B|nr:disulfide bond formation protein B [Aliamphritea ceti]
MGKEVSIFGVTGRPSYRSNNLLGFVVCAGILAAINIYINPQINLTECALCTVTRLTFVAMAGLFFLGFIFNSIGWLQRLFSVFNLLLIALAAIASMRNLAQESRTAAEQCSQPIINVLNINNLDSVVSAYQKASVCPVQDWQLGVLSYAHLSLIALAGLTVVVWKLMTKKARRDAFFR